MITIKVLKNKGYSIIDGKTEYIVKPPIFSLKSYRQLKKRSVITGLVGPRGSGKSVGAVRLAIIDYFLTGIKNVWSNMDISFILERDGVKKEFHSQPIHKLDLIELDRVYDKGLLVVDEVNMEIAEARRSSSKGSLAFSYILQQLRKRELDIIWTAQSEMDCDSRLRRQTDVFLKCHDKSITNCKCGIGELSDYVCYDYAGLINKDLPDDHFNGVFKNTIIWNKPWWNGYSTWQLQGIKNEEAEQAEPEVNPLVLEIVEAVKESARKGDGPIPKVLIWAKWSIRTFTDRQRLARLLAEQGIISTVDGRKYIIEEAYA
jgi:hypothetical protein